MDTKTKLLGLRAIEIPVRIVGESGAMEDDTLSILFKPLSPKRSADMREKYAALQPKPDDLLEEVVEETETKSIDELSHLLSETVVSLCFKSGGEPLKAGADFEFEALDDRLRLDIWKGIQDYTYPKLTA